MMLPRLLLLLAMEGYFQNASREVPHTGGRRCDLLHHES